MDVVVKTRDWGNSIGIILPASFVREEGIKSGDEIILSVEKKTNVLKELFGSMKFKKPTEEALRDFRKEMESKWL